MTLLYIIFTTKGPQFAIEVAEGSSAEETLRYLITTSLCFTHGEKKTLSI